MPTTPGLVDFTILFRWGSNSAEEMNPSNMVCHTESVLTKVYATTMVQMSKEDSQEVHSSLPGRNHRLSKRSPVRNIPTSYGSLTNWLHHSDPNSFSPLARWNPTKFSGFSSEHSFVLMVKDSHCGLARLLPGSLSIDIIPSEAD